MKTTKHILALVLGLAFIGGSAAQAADPASAKTTAGQARKPNILVIWGDDIGTWNICHNNRGMMGYKTPNIDRIAQQSCTAGRAAFISGSAPVRSGMTKVGMPNAKCSSKKTAGKNEPFW